jgi:multidrug transporter EmrE-like cation transporter
MALEVPPPEAIPLAGDASTRSSLISLVLVLISVGLATAGHFTLKRAMNEVGRIGTAQINSIGDTVSRAAREPLLWLGLCLFGVSALFWLVVLSRVPLSVAYPFAGLSYIVIVFLDRIVLHEQIPSLRWMGAAIVAVGIALIGISSRTVSGG